MSKQNVNQIVVLAMAASAVVYGLSSASAAIMTWSGTADNNWITGGAGGNWSGATVPGGSDTAAFNSNPTNNSPVIGGTAQSVAGVTFLPGAGAFTIGTAGQLLNVAGPGIVVNSGVTTDQTFTSNLTETASASLPFTNNGSGNLILQGTITPSSAKGMTKSGSGVVTVNGSGTFAANGATTLAISAGTLALNYSAGSENRIADGVAIAPQGGELVINGSASANTTETAGALSLAYNSTSIITVSPGSGKNATLTRASFGRNYGTTVLFRGPSLGGSGTSDTANIVLTAAPTLVGGAGLAGSTTQKIIFGVIGDTSVTGTGTDFVTYDAGTKTIRPLSFANGEYASDFLTGGANVRVTNPQGTGGSYTVNSLLVGPGGSVTASDTKILTVTSGMIMAVGGANSGIGATGSGSIKTGGEMMITTISDLAISSPISVGGGFNKSGPGTLTLSGAVTGITTGNVRVIDGKLVLGVDNPFNGVPTFLSSKGIIDLNGHTLITSANNGTSGIIMDSSSGAAGTFTVNAANDVSAVLAGNLNFTYIGPGAGTSKLPAANTYTGVTTVNSGTLTFNSTNSAAYSRKIVVGSGATLILPASFQAGNVVAQSLAGSGTITGAVTIAGSGILDPGNGTSATLALTANNAALIMSTGAALNLAIDGTTASPTNSMVNLTGTTSTVTLGSANSYTLNVINLGAVDPTGKIFNLIHYTGTSPSLANLGIWTINYGSGATGWSAGAVGVDTVGGYITLSNITIPEPATITLALGIGSLCLLARRRRQA